jgi:type IV secretory pathway TrbD component
MPAGTATLACSLTVTDTVVVWLVSGSTTVVCADADPLHITPTMRAATGHRINRT